MTYLEQTYVAYELTSFFHLDNHLLLSYGGSDGAQRVFDLSTDPESAHPHLLTGVSSCEALPEHLAFHYVERFEASERTLSLYVPSPAKREAILERCGRAAEPYQRIPPPSTPEPGQVAAAYPQPGISSHGGSAAQLR